MNEVTPMKCSRHSELSVYGGWGMLRAVLTAKMQGNCLNSLTAAIVTTTTAAAATANTALPTDIFLLPLIFHKNCTHLGTCEFPEVCARMPTHTQTPLYGVYSLNQYCIILGIQRFCKLGVAFAQKTCS